MLETVNETLKEVEASFQSFKNKQEKRLQNLEKQQVLQKTGLSKEAPALERAQKYKNDTTHFVKFLRGHQDFCTKALTAGDEPGQFVMPTYLRTRLREQMEKIRVFRSRASRMEISSSFVDILLDEGLAEVAWVGETDARPETAPSDLRRCRIPVHELYAKPCATHKLLEDAAVNVEEWLLHKVSAQMARMENEAFLKGSGKDQPKGVLNYLSSERPPVWSVFEEIKTGIAGEFPKNALSLIVALLHKLPTRYLDGAVWVMSPSTLGALRSRLSSHSVLSYVRGVEEAFGAKLFGYDVVLMDEMPALVPGESSKSLFFGNLKEAYQVVDRQEIHILRDPYSSKPYVEFYINKRVGGDVINFDALKIMNFAEGEG